MYFRSFLFYSSYSTRVFNSTDQNNAQISHATSPTPMPRPHGISNSSVIVCSRLCFTQNMILCNLILSLVAVEHIAIVARFSYCITGI